MLAQNQTAVIKISCLTTLSNKHAAHRLVQHTLQDMEMALSHVLYWQRQWSKFYIVQNGTHVRITW